MPTTFSRRDVTLSNWRLRPYSAWSFQNVQELVPSVVIRPSGAAETPATGLDHLADIGFADETGAPTTIGAWLPATETDSLVIMRDGAFIGEWHAANVDPVRPHLIFSISKSFTGILAGIVLKGRMALLDRPLVELLPDFAGSAYADATLRHLLTMSVSLDFEESYLDTTGGYDRYRRAMLWNPERPDEATPSLRQFFATLPKAAEAHGAVHRYRSPNADLAALVLEEIAGERFADMISKYIWQKIGACNDGFMTVDRAGHPRGSGGISVTPRDLCRFGEMVRLGGNGIVPADWIESLYAGGDKAVWAAGHQAHIFPQGSYLWYWYNSGSGPICGIGIHGQWVWVDRAARLVVVRTASESVPVNDAREYATVRMMTAIAKAL